VPQSPANAPEVSALGSARRRQRLAALFVALTTFALYRATLLPGQDLGDTASFQTIVGASILTPRQGYPLYFAIGDLFLRVAGGDPARALNLASAIEAAIATGLIVLVAAELSGSPAAAAGAALLFGVSYTFWSQAVIAEVYALHVIFVCLTLLLLLRWADKPTTARLALFFAVYALGFGNHLSMILLAPAYAAFLLIAAPGGWRSMFRPRTLALALGIACAGALQYAGQLHALWLSPQPPPTLSLGLQQFWFDVTKSDWRDTMVMNVPRNMLRDHAAMYLFDLRQQFGVAGPVFGAAGMLGLASKNLKRAILMLLLFAVNLMFAYSYNVGDSHVFYLPSHLIIALLAASGVTFLTRSGKRVTPILAALLLVYTAARAYRDYPALDRSRDRRAEEMMAELTEGLDDQHAILITDLNWQLQNGLAYFAKVTRPEVAWTRMPEVLLYAPALVADNHAIGRDVIVTDRARVSLAAAYGPLLPVVPDVRVRVPRLAEIVSDLPVGTRYVICVLRPSRDLSLDAADLRQALGSLTATRMQSLPLDSDYAAVAGRVGDPPLYIAASSSPFRRIMDIGGVVTEVRMDSWLASDTIRRMGFGHVIAGRHHTLIVERGISFVAFDDRGEPIRTGYASNIFAPQPRYLIQRN
jgi:predicted anti-sigma-YlaC factor YlaD